MAAWRARNPERNRELDRAAKVNNRERIRAADRERYWRDPQATRAAKNARRLANSDAYRASEARHRECNREALAEKSRIHCAKRRATPRGRLENTIRSGVHAEIKRGSKCGRKTFDILGYNCQELMVHLERQFARGMNWQNYGEWHIDHIRPLSSFIYETPDDPDFRKAWGLTNLRPLWAIDNLSKGAKRLLLV